MGSARFRIHPSTPDGWVFSLVAPNHRIMARSARASPDVPTLLSWIDSFRMQARHGEFEVLMSGQPGAWVWRLREPVELAVCPSPMPRRVDAAKAARAVRRAAAQADVRLPADAPLAVRPTRPARLRRAARPRRPDTPSPPALLEARRLIRTSLAGDAWPATLHAAS